MIPLPPSTYLKAGAALIVLAIIGGVWATIAIKDRKIDRLTAANAVLRSNLDQALAVNRDTMKAFADFQADAARAMAAVQRDHAAELDRAKRSATIKQEISRAAPTEDRAVGPVLGRVLDRLRERAPAGDQARAGGPANPAGAAGVRP